MSCARQAPAAAHSVQTHQHQKPGCWSNHLFLHESVDFIHLVPNMAVTEAGCDLTYCRMRGIVAVLTGERLKGCIQPFPQLFYYNQQND